MLPARVQNHITKPLAPASHPTGTPASSVKLLLRGQTGRRGPLISPVSGWPRPASLAARAPWQANPETSVARIPGGW